MPPFAPPPGQKPFPCPKCDAFFSTKSNCERHLLRKHGVTARTLRRNGAIAKKDGDEGSHESAGQSHTLVVTAGTAACVLMFCVDVVVLLQRASQRRSRSHQRCRIPASPRMKVPPPLQITSPPLSSKRRDQEAPPLNQTRVSEERKWTRSNQAKVQLVSNVTLGCFRSRWCRRATGDRKHRANGAAGSAREQRDGGEAAPAQQQQQ